jgi:2-dehydropantoate 2-reductase
VRIAVVGAGAIGGYLASQLERASHHVTVVTRPEYVDTLAHQGIRVRIRGEMTTTRVQAVDRLRDTPDLLFFTVKTQDLSAACEAVRPVASGVTAVTLQNGVRADSIVASILGPDSIVGGIAMCAVTCLEPGVVTVDVPGWFLVGSPSVASNGRLSAVSRTLRPVVPTFITRNLAGARWSKLIGNLTNGLTAATGLSLADLARHPAGRRLAVEVMREGHRVARTAGIHLDHQVYGLQPLALLQTVVTNLLPVLPTDVSARILSLAGRSSLGRADFRGSTWQSLARGKTTEVDYLNGEIVQLGTRLGVATPYNARVLDAVHAAERSKHSMPLDELWPIAA